jgi:pimeloyl-ACP methyl ester carboxylesterase
MAFSTVSGPAGQLHVDDGGGSGTPVLFLHSFSGSASHWSAQLAELRPKHRAVAFDLRGHGKSEMPKDLETLTVERMAGDVAAVANKLDLGRFVLVGHSIGGAVAIAFAASHPDRLAGLVLVGTPGKTPEEQAEQVLTAMNADYDGVTRKYWEQLLTDARPEVHERIGREMQMLPKEVGLVLIKAIFDFDPVPGLKAYRGPKLAIVTGEKDQPNDLHKQVPDLPHQRITGTSHWPHMDKPEDFNAILEAFLSTIAPAIEALPKHRAAE